ncbi:MAG TPA: hypothetical protein VLF89_08850, partial [Candidatus Saccharimonadales bacterium]|nr:hypothetical protein [Candidatus Saccharimonadales bacterium]
KIILTPTPTITPIMTRKPTNTPTPTIFLPTATPTIQYIAPTATPVPVVQQSSQTTSGGFACNCAKTCSQMSSCMEAQYQLNACGCTARDADHDGTACDAQCQ